MKPNKTFDKEKLSFNIAKLKRSGETFEIVIDSDNAIAFKEGKDVEMEDIIKSEEIFFDANKSQAASDAELEKAFETTDFQTIAERILKEGEIHLTAVYRAKVRENKRKSIIQIIHQNGIDPRTDAPHPITRIENAFEEGKVKIDEFKTAENQVKGILRILQPIMPIKFEKKTLEVHLTPEYAGKSIGAVKSTGEMKQSKWLDDGACLCVVEIPAGMMNEYMDKLNEVTHGTVQIQIIDR